VGESSVARGGDVVALANSVDAVVNSSQLGGANGSGTISSTAISQLMRSLGQPTPIPFAASATPQANVTTVQSGVLASSGDSLAAGMHSTVRQNNVQMGGCATPGTDCVVRNSATMTISVSDLPNNPASEELNPGKPAPGGVEATGSCACANVTPTPVPTPRPSSSASGSSGGRSGSGGGQRKTASGQTTLTVASGHVVVVDLWNSFPNRRLPPMPGPGSRDPANSTVNASLDTWPGADELPLPDLGAQQVARQSAARPGLSRAPATRQADAAVSDELEPLPMLQMVDVDLWSTWPGVDELPMPPQAAVEVAGEQAAAVAPASDAAPTAAIDAGLDGRDFAVPAALGLILAGLAGSRRGRLLLRSVTAATRRQALGVVRMTLGLFGLWHL
jgi:hypothetical protein